MRKNHGSRFENGSIGGVCLTVILLGVSLGYFASVSSSMNNSAYDSFKSEKLTNPMKEWAEFKMNDYTFMPNIEILQSGEETQSFRIQEIMNQDDLGLVGEGGYYAPFPIDTKKLLTYVVPVINFRQIIDGKTTYITEPMRRCTTKDFEDRGYQFTTEDDKEFAGFKFCPNWEKLDFLKVKNNYNNKMERYSYSVEIHQCNPKVSGNCQTQEKITNFLELMMFNLYTLVEDQEIGNNENYGKSPLVSKDVFHSQFKLSGDQYRDNNNFLAHNLVTTNDFRNPLFYEKKTFQFLELVINPVWVGPTKIMKYTVSRDQGKTYSSEYDQVLFGSFFFVSEERRVYSREVFTFVDLLSQVGGLISLLNIVFVVLGTFINMNAMLWAIVEKIYYFTPDGTMYETVHLQGWDQLCFPCSRCCRPSKHQKSYQKAIQNVKKDLDIIHLIQTQRKLAAGIATIIQNDQTKIKQAKKLYYKEICIADHILERDKLGFLSEKNEYLKFLQSDDKNEDTQFLEEEFKQVRFIRRQSQDELVRRKSLDEKNEIQLESISNSEDYQGVELYQKPRGPKKGKVGVARTSKAELAEDQNESISKNLINTARRSNDGSLYPKI